MARLTPITSKDQVAPEAHAIVDGIVKSRGGLHGPFSMFLHAPELAERVAHLGAYVRFEGGLDMRVRVLAAMTVARELDAVYVWGAQTGSARRQSVPESTITAIREGHMRGVPAEDAQIIDFTRRLMREHRVDDATAARAPAALRRPRPHRADGQHRLLCVARHDGERLRARGGPRRRGAEGSVGMMGHVRSIRGLAAVAALALATALTHRSPRRSRRPPRGRSASPSTSPWLRSGSTPAETESAITPFMVLYAIHDALVKPMPGGLNTPSLAESWTASKDGVTYEFLLRNGIKFHNGDPVTADDVKFSFERYRGGGAKLFKERVKEVRVVDARRVRFVMKEPWPDFMTFYGTTATGAGWIVPKKYVEKVGDEGFLKAPIGAGPYKYVSQNQGIDLTLEAFEGYWRKVPSVKRLVLKSVPDETTRAAALKRGEVDIAYFLNGPIAEDVRKTPGLKLMAARTNTIFFLDFVEQWEPKSPWHDQRVRLAASLAIDRKAINDAESLGFSGLTGNIVPRHMEFALPIEPHPYDRQARQAAPRRRRLCERIRRGRPHAEPAVLRDGGGDHQLPRGGGNPDPLRSMERAAFLTSYRREEAEGRRHGPPGHGGQCGHAYRDDGHQERPLRLRRAARGGGPLPAPGQGARSEEARGAAPPGPEDPPRQGGLRPDLGERLHPRRRAPAWRSRG